MRHLLLVLLVLSACEDSDIAWMDGDEDGLAYICVSNGEVLHCGTGFFISKNEIVTAYHTIDDMTATENPWYVYLGKNKETLIRDVEIVKTSQGNDLVMIRLPSYESGGWFEVCSTDAEWDNDIYITSYVDTKLEIEKGRVRRTKMAGYPGWIRTTANGYPGNSGSPIFDAVYGCVVGVERKGGFGDTVGPGTGILRNFVRN